jgi:hypothetical protein
MVLEGFQILIIIPRFYPHLVRGRLLDGSIELVVPQPFAVTVPPVRERAVDRIAETKHEVNVRECVGYSLRCASAVNIRWGRFTDYLLRRWIKLISIPIYISVPIHVEIM